MRVARGVGVPMDDCGGALPTTAVRAARRRRRSGKHELHCARGPERAMREVAVVEAGDCEHPHAYSAPAIQAPVARRRPRTRRGKPGASPTNGAARSQSMRSALVHLDQLSPCVEPAPQGTPAPLAREASKDACQGVRGVEHCASPIAGVMTYTHRGRSTDAGSMGEPPRASERYSSPALQRAHAVPTVKRQPRQRRAVTSRRALSGTGREPTSHCSQRMPPGWNCVCSIRRETRDRTHRAAGIYRRDLAWLSS